MRARHRAHPGQMPALPDQPLFPGGRDIKYKHCFLVDAYIEAYEEGATLPDRQLDGSISGRAMTLAMEARRRMKGVWRHHVRLHWVPIIFVFR